MTDVHIRRTLDAWRVSLRTTDDRFLEELDTFKFHIPQHLRRYNPSTKQWLVDPCAERELGRWVRLVEREGGRVTIDDDPDPEPRSRKSYKRPDWRAQEGECENAYATFYLLPTAPVEIVKLVYRHLSKKAHPDVGGSHEQMLALNNALDEIEGRQVAA